MLRLLTLCTSETVIWGLLFMLVLWIVLFLLMWWWIRLWNRKWVNKHRDILGLILLVAFSLPAATLWVNIQTANEVLHDKCRLCEKIKPLNDWTMRSVLDEIPANVAENQQAERLFTALCQKTKCPLPYESTYRFEPDAELRDSLQSLYRSRTYVHERDRIFQNIKEQLDDNIHRSLADAQFRCNEVKLREWACLNRNPTLLNFAIFCLMLFAILFIATPVVAYMDIQRIYPVEPL